MPLLSASVGSQPLPFSRSGGCRSRVAFGQNDDVMDPDQPVPPGSPPPPDAPPVVVVPKPRIERIGTVLACIVPLLVLAALVCALMPVRNGRVQDCGTPLAFLAQGRTEAQLPDVDRPGQEDEPPRNFTEEEYREAAERSCRDRAAPRMVWAGGLTLAAFLLGLAALTMTVVGRYWLTRPPAPDLPGPPDPDPIDVSPGPGQHT